MELLNLQACLLPPSFSVISVCGQPVPHIVDHREDVLQTRLHSNCRRFYPNGQARSGKGCLSTSWQLKCPQLGGGQMAHRSSPPAARLMPADRTTELTTHSRKQYAHAVPILHQSNKSKTTDARGACRYWQLYCQIAMRGRVLFFHSGTR